MDEQKQEQKPEVKQPAASYKLTKEENEELSSTSQMIVYWATEIVRAEEKITYAKSVMAEAEAEKDNAMKQRELSRAMVDSQARILARSRGESAGYHWVYSNPDQSIVRKNAPTMGL